MTPLEKRETAYRDDTALPIMARGMAAGEARYRRGYHQGYHRALDDIETLLRAGHSIGTALSRTSLHADGALADWRRALETTDTPPELEAAP